MFYLCGDTPCIRMLLCLKQTQNSPKHAEICVFVSDFSFLQLLCDSFLLWTVLFQSLHKNIHLGTLYNFCYFHKSTRMTHWKVEGTQTTISLNSSFLFFIFLVPVLDLQVGLTSEGTRQNRFSVSFILSDGKREFNRPEQHHELPEHLKHTTVKVSPASKLPG